MKEEKVKIGETYRYQPDVTAYVLSKHDGLAYCKITRMGTWSDYAYINYGDLHVLPE
jgi:hypothetical protein